MTVAIDGGSGAVLLLEQFDEMRRVGERAFDADLGDGFRGGYEQQTRLHKPLADEPPVGRHEEMAFELLLERGERTVAQRRKFLDRDVAEDARVDDLLEIVARGIHIRQYLAFQAAVGLRYDKVYKFRHLNVLGRLVVHEIVVLQIAGGMAEEAADRRRRRHRHMVQTAAAVAGVGIGYVDGIGHIEIQQNALQQFGRIVDDDLFERAAVLGNVLDVVISDSHVKDIAFRYGMARIAVIDMLRTAHHIADGITRKRQHLDSPVIRSDIFDDRRLILFVWSHTLHVLYFYINYVDNDIQRYE